LKDTFTGIYSLHIKEYQKSIDSVMIDSERENKEATQDNESDDSGDDSDENDSDYVDLEEEEESDGSGTQNTLGKEPGQEEMVVIETIVENAIDNNATESGKEKALDTNNKSETDKAGNNKRAGDDNLEEGKEKKAKKSNARKR